jgi:hypothetical protein
MSDINSGKKFPNFYIISHYHLFHVIFSCHEKINAAYFIYLLFLTFSVQEAFWFLHLLRLITVKKEYHENLFIHTF